MKINIRLSCMLIVAALFAAPSARAEDIAGFWKLSDNPAWIDINLDAGKATVVRNDKFPDRVGREILVDLEAHGSEPGQWSGRIYSEKMGEYKDALITLKEPDLMSIKVKVGFMSRTLEWRRVSVVPKEANANPV